MNYNSLSLRQFREYFSSLAVPDLASLRGQYRASFVGPAWLRVTAAPGLVPLGFGGWWGKDFNADGTAINILLRAGKFSPCTIRPAIPSRGRMWSMRFAALMTRPCSA
jgi:hypothetical protein